MHEFKGEPPGSTRRVTDRRARPILSPIEYFHQFITDEMLEEIVESTNAHLHATLGEETPPRGYPASRKWPPAWAKASKDRSLAEIKKFLGCCTPSARGRTRACPSKTCCPRTSFHGPRTSRGKRNTA